MDNHENMSDSKTVFYLGVSVFVLIVIAVFAYVVADIASAGVERPRSNQDIVATAERIEPVGKSNLASNPNPELGKVVVAEAAPAAFSAESAYNVSCAACHNSGAAGAPKFGDKAGWASRVAAGIETLYSNAINGKGGMPARGGSSLTDDQIKTVVDYMLENNK